MAVIIHELGHYLFGLLSGYSLIYIEVLGFTLEQHGAKYRFKRYPKMPIGQCIMAPKKKSANPVFIVSGGMALNLITGIWMFFAVFSAGSYIFGIFFLTESVVNISLFLTNAFFGSVTSDGNTLKEILTDRRNAESYNTIMLIAGCLKEGRSYIEMPDHLFSDLCGKKTKKRHKWEESSLKTEMEAHIYRYRLEKGEVPWNREQAGEPIGDMVDGILRKRSDERDRYILKMKERSSSALFPGEYICAIRCINVTERIK